MTEFTGIYETMLGLREEEAQVAGVENAFADGSCCAAAYETMRTAYERICGRLGVQNEDHDLEQLVAALETIQKELCSRAFALGMNRAME